MAKKMKIIKKIRLAVIRSAAFLCLASFLLFLYITPKIQNLKAESVQAAEIKYVSTESTPAPLPTASPTLVPTVYIPKGKSAKVPILTYHYISTAAPDDLTRQSLAVPAEVFDGQMQYLSQNGFTTITLDDLYNYFYREVPLPPKPVIITLDDGYYDAYVNAFPIFKKYNFKATIFLPTDLMETSIYLHWSQIQEMASSGNIVFGSHTRQHKWLPGQNMETLSNEIVESKRILEEKLGTKVNWFSYPYGASDGQVRSIVQKANYLGAVTTLPGEWNSQSEIYSLRRVKIGNYPISYFANALSQ